MINDIIIGISNAIYAEFGSDYEIYVDDVKQGLNEPCFFIKALNSTNNRYLGNRRKLTNPFVIQYFPKSNKPKTECNDVSDRLMNILDMITVDEDKILGSNMQCQVTDNVLTCTVNYNFFGYKNVAKEPTFEDIKVKGGLNNG